ncbi:hypothetical protein UVI_02043930 [Ustilaginoidea virens]|uniref:WW domain-containing protein n=1 Tax=Ustilaginoidea virens TaxID=1159556 RepID=A0A1B5L4A2_USTVR|nr:hypothetical protein UVI_02043930 [Ustilaginoidea virens]
MSGLPHGWEWDYDGQRWFYKYKPTGHVQYRFPSEGDEFPDFVQAAAPAPDLTPEECLESQRQLARQSNLNGTAGAAAGDAARRGADGGGTTSKFGVSSAMAEPINTVWESDEREAEDAVFQPENFMFLGPGAFTDVSPLNEEEEEAAKRTVVGGIGERVEGAPRGASGSAAAALAKGVSPVGSGESTPVMRKSEPSLSPKPNVVGDPVENTAAIESPPDYETAPVTERTPVVESEVAAALPPVAEADPSPRAAEAPDTAAAHMIDSREMPVEMLGDTMHRPDPVGLVAEMPTEHTPASHIELHPDPVEIADNSILAPIETAKAALAGTAGFPGSNSHIDWGGVRIVQTSERKPPSEVEQILLTGKTTGRETRGTGHEEAGQAVVRPADSHQEERAFQPGRRDPQTKPITPSPALDDPQTEPTVRSPPKLENLRIAREHRGVSSAPSTPVRTQPLYRPYVPGQTVAPHRQAQLPTSEKRQSVSLQREASLAMNMKRGSVPIDPSTVPRVLFPSSSSPSQSASVAGQAPDGKVRTWQSSLSLADVPSVLRPARNPGISLQGVPWQQQQPGLQGAPSSAPSRGARSDGVSQVPSVLRPARGRSPSLPGRDVQAIDAQPGARLSSGPRFQPWQPQTTSSRPTGAMPLMGHAPYGVGHAVLGSDLPPVLAPAPVASMQLPQQSRPPAVEQQVPSSVWQFRVPPAQHIQDAVAGQPARLQAVDGSMQRASGGVGSLQARPRSQSICAVPQQQLQQQQLQSCPIQVNPNQSQNLQSPQSLFPLGYRE